jgi:hypothetical protein
MHSRLAPLPQSIPPLCCPLLDAREGYVPPQDEPRSRRRRVSVCRARLLPGVLPRGARCSSRVEVEHRLVGNLHLSIAGAMVA